MSGDNRRGTRLRSAPPGVWGWGLLGLLFPLFWFFAGSGFIVNPWRQLAGIVILLIGLLFRSRIAWLLAFPWTLLGIFYYASWFASVPQPYLAIVIGVTLVRLLALMLPGTLRFIWRRKTPPR